MKMTARQVIDDLLDLNNHMVKCDLFHIDDIGAYCDCDYWRKRIRELDEELEGE